MHTADTLESRLFRSYWDDGLLDLFAGLGVVGIGFFWAVDLIAISTVIPVVLAPFWSPLRRVLVQPRIGFVEFSDARIASTRTLARQSVVLGVVMLALFIGTLILIEPQSDDWLSAFVPGLPAYLLGLLAAMVAWGLGLSRFFTYTGIFLAAGFVVAFRDAGPELAMFAGGFAMLANGAWRFAALLMLPVEHTVED